MRPHAPVAPRLPSAAAPTPSGTRDEEPDCGQPAREPDSAAVTATQGEPVRRITRNHVLFGLLSAILFLAVLAVASAR